MITFFTPLKCMIRQKQKPGTFTAGEFKKTLGTTDKVDSPEKQKEQDKASVVMEAPSTGAIERMRKAKAENIKAVLKDEPNTNTINLKDKALQERLEADIAKLEDEQAAYVKKINELINQAPREGTAVFTVAADKINQGKKEAERKELIQRKKAQLEEMRKIQKANAELAEQEKIKQLKEDAQKKKNLELAEKEKEDRAAKEKELEKKKEEDKQKEKEREAAIAKEKADEEKQKEAEKEKQKKAEKEQNSSQKAEKKGKSSSEESSGEESLGAEGVVAQLIKKMKANAKNASGANNESFDSDFSDIVEFPNELRVSIVKSVGGDINPSKETVKWKSSVVHQNYKKQKRDLEAIKYNSFFRIFLSRALDEDYENKANELHKECLLENRLFTCLSFFFSYLRKKFHAEKKKLGDVRVGGVTEISEREIERPNTKNSNHKIIGSPFCLIFSLPEVGTTIVHTFIVFFNNVAGLDGKRCSIAEQVIFPKIGGQRVFSTPRYFECCYFNYSKEEKEIKKQIEEKEKEEKEKEDQIEAKKKEKKVKKAKRRKSVDNEKKKELNNSSDSNNEREEATEPIKKEKGKDKKK